MLNPDGKVSEAVESGLLSAGQVVLIPETKASSSRPLPAPGGWQAFEARRPRGSGGGVAQLVLGSIAAQQWRSVREDGVLWVLLQGALRGARTLALSVCYHRPTGHGGQPVQEARQEAAEWWQRRAAEWGAAAEAGWVPVLGGDFNTHVGTEPDWPAWETCTSRRSRDTLPLDWRGELLLQFCRDMGARLANGRVDGDRQGAATSFGTGAARGKASSVVDYFIVPASYLSEVRGMRVAPEMAVADHAGLVLRLRGAAQQPQQAQPAVADPCLLRFPTAPPSDERLEAAAAHVGGATAWLAAITAAARQASTPAAIEDVARQRCTLVAAACSGAGIRPAGSGGRAGGVERRLAPPVQPAHPLPQPPAPPFAFPEMFGKCSPVVRVLHVPSCMFRPACSPPPFVPGCSTPAPLSPAAFPPLFCPVRLAFTTLAPSFPPWCKATADQQGAAQLGCPSTLRSGTACQRCERPSAGSGAGSGAVQHT